MSKDLLEHINDLISEEALSMDGKEVRNLIGPDSVKRSSELIKKLDRTINDSLEAFL